MAQYAKSHNLCNNNIYKYFFFLSTCVLVTIPFPLFPRGSLVREATTINSKAPICQAEEFIPLVDSDSVLSKLIYSKRLYLEGKLKIYVFHMHKGGGSTLCKFFIQSNLSVSVNNNCNGNSELHAAAKTSYDGLKSALAEEKLDVVFNEGLMNPSSLELNEYLYLSTVRDPIIRTISQMSHAWKAHLDYDGDGRIINISEWVRKWRMSIYYSPNIQSRMLLGNASMLGYTLPDAIKRLNEFTFIITTEDLSEGLEMVEQYLGITMTGPSILPLGPKTARNGLVTNADKSAELLRKVDPDLYFTLYFENCDDFALYRYAQNLYAVQLACFRLWPEKLV